MNDLRVDYSRYNAKHQPQAQDKNVCITNLHFLHL
jgi:hypothetical protein